MQDIGDPLSGIEHATAGQGAMHGQMQDWTCPPAEVGARLLAAKQVRWRGESELPQLPYGRPGAGLFLVLDLWSGLGGLVVGLLALGMRCLVVSAEADPELRRVQAKAFSGAIHVARVEDIRADMLRSVLSRRDFAGILLGGGGHAKGTVL